MSRLHNKIDGTQYVELSPEDCALLYPMVAKAKRNLEAKVARYRDIHESGEATTRQQDIMFKSEDDFCRMSRLAEDIYAVVKKGGAQ